MGKKAVRNQLHEFLEDVTQYALEDFDVLNVVHLGWLPLSGLQNRFWKWLLGPVIDRELNVIKICLQNEFNIIVDYAEDVEHGGADVDDYRQRFLDNDIFYTNYRGPQEHELERDLMKRLREVGEDMAPIVAAGTDDFWDAVVEAYDYDEAVELFEYHFSWTDTIVEKYGSDIRLALELGPIGIPYTGEAMRVLPQAEGYLRDEILERLEEEYEGNREREMEQLRAENRQLRRKVQQLEEQNEELEQQTGDSGAGGGAGAESSPADGGIED
jgi:hypothetical protein